MWGDWMLEGVALELANAINGGQVEKVRKILNRYDVSDQRLHGFLSSLLTKPFARGKYKAQTPKDRAKNTRYYKSQTRTNIINLLNEKIENIENEKKDSRKKKNNIEFL